MQLTDQGGDKAEKGMAYDTLSNAYLKISKEGEDEVGERRSHAGDLGSVP